MGQPKSYVNSTILAKTEVTQGVDSLPVANTDAMKVLDFTCKPNADTVTRAVNRQFFGNDETHYVNKTYDISFKFELAGAGTADGIIAHAPIILACGHTSVVTAATDVKYTPLSDSPNTVTIYYYQNNTLFKATGCKGSLQVNASIDNPDIVDVTMVAMYQSPVTAVPGAANFSAFRNAPINSKEISELSIHNVLVDGLSFTLNQNNTNAQKQTTETRIIINSDRKTTASCAIWAADLATFDPFNIWEAERRDVVYWQTGIVAGDRVRYSMPQAQIAPPDVSNEDAVTGYKIDFIPHPTPTGVDDEYTITTS